ncbi:hypothetical protein ACLOJK_007423 [Asimina triloba]
MVVSELKEELEAQGLPIDGNRQVLYQQVQKARRINISRGRPLWVPPLVEVEEEQIDNEDLDLSDSSDNADSMDDNSKEEEDNEAEEEEETEEEAEQT